MIGVFDSGYGGLTILRELVRQLPAYSYLYLGDNARAPYGNRPAEEVYEFTKQGVAYLFNQGATLVLLACNTASACALRRVQQEYLPADGLRRVLGIVVPTIEQITDVPWASSLPAGSGKKTTIAVLATRRTVESGVYEHEINKRQPNIKVVQGVGNNLVQLIEEGAEPHVIRSELQTCLTELNDKMPLAEIDALLLGCTHYTLIKDEISRLVPSSVKIYDQPAIVAASLKRYLESHPALEQAIKRQAGVEFFTTGDPGTVSAAATRFWGSSITFNRISEAVLIETGRAFV